MDYKLKCNYSCVGDVDTFDWGVVLTNIYRPLIPQIVSYRELEYEHSKKITDFAFHTDDDLVDIVQAFGQSQLTVFRAAEEAKRRCAVFNHCVFTEMIFAINVIKQYYKNI